MSKEITYEKIKGLDIAVAMKASSKATTADRALKNQSKTVWNQTVSLVMESINLDGVPRETTEEAVASMQEVVKKIITDHIEKHVEIPEEGLNRQGKTFKVKNDKGEIKWGSWDQTRRIIAYAGEIAKVICFNKEDILYPEQFTVAPKSAIMALCKEEKTPLENITRLCKDIQGYADVVEGADVKPAHDLIEAIVVNNVDPMQEAIGLVGRLSGVVAGLDSSELQTLNSTLLQLCKQIQSQQA